MGFRRMSRIITFDTRLRKKNSESILMKLLKKLGTEFYLMALQRYGEEGIIALKSVTPKDSGKTADSWIYTIETDENGRYSVVWRNTNINDGIHIALILEYGHGTGTGGWVEGRQYIDPAIQPIFDRMVSNFWGEVLALL